ncbi:MAG TPA: RNA polymerase sigma-70 factor, partial [Bacteroidales bacterium]|nr:RNA polymerase sigma-70 factor [Bacteroidales bacterium]
VRRLKKNDKKAFELIFNKYKEKLYYYSLSYLQSAAEAEEIIQSTFVSLWENRELLNEEYCLKNFLYKITVNHVYNHLKHRLVMQKYADQVNLKSAEDNNSEESILVNDLQHHIDSLIEELPRQQQVIYKLSRHNGLSNAEIASNLGISIRSVENQIYRALKFIRGKLRQESIINE